MTVKDQYGGTLPAIYSSMLDEIEKHFKEAQIVSGNTGLDNTYVAASMGADIQTPTITVDPGYTASSEDIAHEIWHLKLKVELDSIGFNIESTEKLGGHIVQFSGGENNAGQLFSLLYNITEHHYFFPLMQKSGLDSNGYFIRSLGGIQGWENHLWNSNYQLHVNTLFILQLLSIEYHFPGVGRPYLAISEKNYKKEYNNALELFEILGSFYLLKDETCVFKELVRKFWNFQEPIILDRRDGYIFLQSINIST